MSRYWEGELEEGFSKEYKIITCMKPNRNQHSQGYTREGEFYFGKLMDISVCIRCEARVKLEEKIVNISDSEGNYHEKRVAKAKLHPEARMRCVWFRRWASEHMGEVLTLRSQERQRLNAWLEGGKRKAEWLTRNAHRFLYKDEVECPFCVNSVNGIIVDPNVSSYGNMFAGWQNLVRHINEWHGLVRITKKGKRGGTPRWKIRFNGDETYSNQLSTIDIGDGPLEDLVGEEESSIEVIKTGDVRDDLLDLLK